MKMKKALATILCLAFLIGTTLMPAAASDQISVPMAQTSPTLDGIIDADEWANAYMHDLRLGSGVELFDAYATDIPSYYLGSVFYYMWNDDGLYAAADVKMDMGTFQNPERGEANFVSGSIQFCVWDENGGGMGEMLMWLTCHAEAADGRPVVTNANVGMDDAPGISMAAVKSADGYTAEVLISTAALAEYGINVGAGAKLMILTDTIVDDPSGQVECVCDSPGWSALYTYTLSETPAGKAEVAEVAEAEEAEEVEEIAEAAPAPEEAAPAPAPVPAPNSGNVGFLVLALVVALSAGAFWLARKKTR